MLDDTSVTSENDVYANSMLPQTHLYMPSRVQKTAQERGRMKINRDSAAVGGSKMHLSAHVNTQSGFHN